MVRNLMWGVLSTSLSSKRAEGLKGGHGEESAVQPPSWGCWGAEPNTWTTGCSPPTHTTRLSGDLAVSDVRGDCCHREPEAPWEAQVRASLEADGSGAVPSGQLVLWKEPHQLDACLFSELCRSSALSNWVWF